MYIYSIYDCRNYFLQHFVMKNNNWLSTVVSCHNSWLSVQSRKVMARVATWNFSYCYRCIRHDIGVMRSNQLKATNPQAASVPAPRKPWKNIFWGPKRGHWPSVVVASKYHWRPRIRFSASAKGRPNHPNLKELVGSHRCFEAWSKSSLVTSTILKVVSLNINYGDRKRIFMSTVQGIKPYPNGKFGPSSAQKCCW